MGGLALFEAVWRCRWCTGPAEVQTRVSDWVAERVAEPLTGRGYKVDPMVFDDEADDTGIVKSEGAPKGKTAVKQESTTKATPKPAPKG